MLKIIIAGWFLLFSTFQVFAQPLKTGNQITGYGLLQSFVESSKNIHSVSYSIIKRERIDGKLIEQESEAKIQRQPFRIYLKQIKPKKGVEVLFRENENGNKALINPNGFPWFNLSLDPMSGIMRENQHHTVYNAGFQYVADILDYLMKKHGDASKEYLNYQGEVECGERKCFRVFVDNKAYKQSNYTLKEGETISSISSKLMLNSYRIKELNPEITDTEISYPGKTIVLPNDYAPRMELFIDQQTYLPLQMRVYDDKGLFEEYIYSNVKINPKFSELDFSSENPEYGF